MYGWFTLVNDDLVVSEVRLNPLDPPIKAATDAALKLVNSAFPDKADDKLRRCANLRLMEALKYVDPGDADFAALMTAEFYKRYREPVDGVPGHEIELARIDKLIEHELGTEEPAGSASVELATALKAVGHLLLPSRQPLHFNAWGTWMRQGRLLTDDHPKELTLHRAAIQWLRVAKMPEAQRAAIWDVATALVGSSAYGEIEEVSDGIRELVRCARFDVFVQLQACCNQLFATGVDWQAYVYSAARQGLRIAVENASLGGAEVAEMAAEQGRLLAQQADESLVRESIAAVDRGQQFGGERTASSVAALASVRALREASESARDDALIGAARQRQSDNAILQTWSIYEVHRWIVGSSLVKGQRRKRRGRPAAVRKVEEASIEEASVKEAPPLEPTEADLDWIEQQAYGKTAAFFLDEMRDLLQIAARLDADAAHQQGCIGLVASLTRLREKPAGLDDAASRKLLGHAEAAIEALRSSVKAKQAEAVLMKRFEASVRACLAGETLSPGRRQGGWIAHALGYEDWGWVVKRFHRRWLPGRHVTIDGRRVALDADEALFFYVTASSESGAAFDISVHVGRREEGKSGAPNLAAGDGESFAPMNADEWFDTYVSCCVMHVPFAGQKKQ